jgi:hypothetical protein
MTPLLKQNKKSQDPRVKNVKLKLGVIENPIYKMMILLQQNKKRREPGEKCHARTMMHSKPINLSR